MTAKAFALRPATSADRDAIATIWHEGASLPGVGPVALPSLAELRQRVDAEFAEGWVVTVAETGGAVAGFLAIRPDRALLDHFFLRADSRGAGVGKALFMEAMAAMPDGFTLFTRPGNIRACRFYESHGMRPLREEIHPRFGDVIVFYAWRPSFLSPSWP